MPGLIESTTGLSFGTGLIWLTGGLGGAGGVDNQALANIITETGIPMITEATSDFIVTEIPTPSWVLTGLGIPATLDINFVGNQAWLGTSTTIIPSLLICTRASSGYYQTATGTLINFPNNNTLRYGDNGLLVEESRTNLQLFSQAFDNATWTKANISVTPNILTAPDGSLTAAKLVEDSTSNIHQAYQQPGLTNGAAYTWAVYVKAGERSWIALNLQDAVSPHRAWFNVATGVLGTTDAGVTSSIQPLSNGWYRCSLTFTVGAGGYFSAVRPQTANGQDGYAGDGASGIYIWGAQLEQASFATSYIPTTLASATRAADVVTYAQSLSTFTPSEGTFYTQMAALPSVAAGFIGVIADVTTNTFGIVANPDWATLNQNVAQVADSGVAATTAAKIAAAYSGTAEAISANGNAAVSATAAIPPAQVAGLTFGRNPGNNATTNSYMKRVAFWSERLSNPVLQLLTYANPAPVWVLSSGGLPAALDIDFVNNQAWNTGNTPSIASLLTCTRASSGYYLNANGTLTNFPNNNTLRYGSNGLLVEESRTNLDNFSHGAFNNAYWSPESATISDNAATAPDGTTTASIVAESSIIASHGFFTTSLTGTATSTTYTVSVYAQANGRSFVSLRAGNNVTADRWAAICATLTGAGSITATGNGANGTNVGSSIAALANGWYRIQLQFSIALAAPNFVGVESANSGTPSFQGFGDIVPFQGSGSPAFNVWGIQVEAGAFATSYIPTTSSSATRAADNVVFAGSPPNSFSATAGTYFAITNQVNNLVNARIFGDNVTASAPLFVNNANTAIGTYNQLVILSATLGSGNTSGIVKSTFAYDATPSRAICANNGTVATDANGIGIAGNPEIGSDRGIGAYLDGYVTRFAFWTTKLSNAALQTLTT